MKAKQNKDATITINSTPSALNNINPDILNSIKEMSSNPKWIQAMKDLKEKEELKAKRDSRRGRVG